MAFSGVNHVNSGVRLVRHICVAAIREGVTMVKQQNRGEIYCIDRPSSRRVSVCIVGVVLTAWGVMGASGCSRERVAKFGAGVLQEACADSSNCDSRCPDGSVPMPVSGRCPIPAPGDSGPAPSERLLSAEPLPQSRQPNREPAPQYVPPEKAFESFNQREETAPPPG